MTSANAAGVKFFDFWRDMTTIANLLAFPAIENILVAATLITGS
jgi:hypothetical protein